MSEPNYANVVSAAEHLAVSGRLTPEQRRAFSVLWDGMSDGQKETFTRNWRTKPQAPPPPPPRAQQVLLSVPYFSQRDSATANGERMCFSSTCAMAAAFLKPGCLAGAGQQPDDRYLALVERFGDTTDAQAQIKALGTLGIRATFRTDGTIDHLVAELRAGRPVPVGWLHHGPVSAPTGGGHWTLAIGWDPATREVIMHDPYGEADLVGGNYVNRRVGAGHQRRYSETNWGRRWMVEGPGTGWWLQLAA